MTDAWQFNKSALECNKYMLEHGIATDVTFVVSDQLSNFQPKSLSQQKGNTKERQTFQAHRYQLVSRSPVFYAMLCGDLAETGDIVVEDVHPEAFREMLNYIYTDEIDIKPELAMPLMYASKKYQIPRLTKMSVDYCLTNLTVDNACILFDHSLFFDEPSLAKASMDMIKHQTAACLASSSMVDIRQSTVSKILDSDIFSMTEIDVFAACVEWASHQVRLSGKKVTGPTIREALGDCIPKIRYPVMDVKDFSLQVSSKGILLPYEELSIFRYFSSKDRDAIPQQIFNVKDRFIKPIYTMQFEGPTEEILMRSVKDTMFTLSCNSNIIVTQFILGQVTPGSCDYSSASFAYGEHQCGPRISADVYLNEEQYPVIFTEYPSRMRLKSDMPLKRNTSYRLRIQLHETERSYMDCLLSGSTIRRAKCCDMDLVNSKTAVHVSLSTSRPKNMYVLGFEYNIV